MNLHCLVLLLMAADGGVPPEPTMAAFERFARVLKDAPKQELDPAAAKCLAVVWAAVGTDLRDDRNSKSKIEVRVNGEMCFVSLVPPVSGMTGGSLYYFVENGRVVARMLGK